LSSVFFALIFYAIWQTEGFSYRYRYLLIQQGAGISSHSMSGDCGKINYVVADVQYEGIERHMPMSA